MKMLRVFLGVVAFAALFATFVGSARANTRDKKTILTFSHPIEVPGNVVLPAGKYIFKLHDSSYRNIVQIWNANESKLITTILAISDVRLTPSEKPIVEFNEQAGSAPHTVRAWFYPGETIGRAFVYSKPRAEELAKINDVDVPAETVQAAVSELATVPLVAITPEDREETIAQAFDAPVLQAEIAEAVVPQELPHTASSTPLIALLGTGLIGAALGLKRWAGQQS
jgi:hypothetical protein